MRIRKQPTLHMILLALSAVSLTAESATPEKGAPIRPTGYADLAPPSHYSPERGVVCFSDTHDAAGQLTGACFNTKGASPFLTQQYLSLSAAIAVNKRYMPSRRVSTFHVGAGFYCDSAKRTCYYRATHTAKPVIAKRHTKALYGFPRLPKDRPADWQILPPLAVQSYRWMNTQQLSLPKTTSSKQIAKALLSAFGTKEPSEGHYTETIERCSDPSHNAGATVLTLSNLPDDAIRSIQYVVETHDTHANTKITGFGQRFQCWRGANAGKWTIQPCL
ncbi:MAG: YcgJ family protein [Leucothrix sp.]